MKTRNFLPSFAIFYIVSWTAYFSMFFLFMYFFSQYSIYEIFNRSLTFTVTFSLFFALIMAAMFRGKTIIIPVLNSREEMKGVVSEALGKAGYKIGEENGSEVKFVPVRNSAFLSGHIILTFQDKMAAVYGLLMHMVVLERKFKA